LLLVSWRLMPFLPVWSRRTKPLGCWATRRRKPAAQRTADLSMDQTSPIVRDACSIRCASATPFPTGLALRVRSFAVKQRAAPHHPLASHQQRRRTSALSHPLTVITTFRRCGCCSCRSCQCYIHHRRSNQHSLPLLVSPSHLRQHYQSHRLRLLHHRSWCTTTTAPLLSPSSSLPLPLSLNHRHLRHCRHRFRHQQN